MFGLLVEIGSFYVKFLAISAYVRLGCHTLVPLALGSICGGGGGGSALAIVRLVLAFS